MGKGISMVGEIEIQEKEEMEVDNRGEPIQVKY